MRGKVSRCVEQRILPDVGLSKHLGMEFDMSDFRLKHDTWVLVADGEKALFLRNEGDAEYPNLEVVREMHDDNPPTREQGTDQPGPLL